MSGAGGASYAVVLPVYNGGPLIGETLESVLKQTLPPTVVVVVDDCSTDDTRAVVEGFADRGVVYLRTPQNCGGPAGPRNQGLAWVKDQHPTLEFIAFLDADDLWPPKFAEQMLAHIGSSDAIFSHFEKFTGRFAPAESARRLVALNLPKWLFRFCNPVTSCSTNMIRLSAIGDIRFNEDRAYIANEDYYFFADLARRAHELRYICNLKVGYRQSGASLSGDKFVMARKRIRLRARALQGQALASLRSVIVEPSYFAFKLGWRAYLMMRARG